MALTGDSGSRLKKWAPGLAGLACLLAVGCATADNHVPAGPAPAAHALTPEQLLGIEGVSIRWSAQGMMLDFRYRVVDPVKALPLMNHLVKPHLVEEASGARFDIPSSPTVGPMRQTALRAEVGRVYWMLFGNPARSVKQGDKVTVVVGDIRLEHITVK